MSKKPGKKKHYCPQNAIDHPKLGFFDNMVRNQTALNDLKVRVQESRHGFKEGTTGATRDRFNAVKLYEAIEQGTHPTCGPADLEFLADLFTKKIATYHKFKALGVELSPDGKPMLIGNIPINLSEGKGIREAVATAKDPKYRGGFPIVSCNVWGQLTNEQRRELAEVDNIHQYSVEPRSRVKDSNPTGIYPHVPDDSGIGITYAEKPGVNRIYHFRECSYTLEVTEFVLPPVYVEIGSDLADEYGIGIGRFKVDCSGITAVGPLSPGADRGMCDSKVRSALEKFKERDSIGVHATATDLVGPVSKKVDGIFVKLVATQGVAEFRFRNGRRWVSGEGQCTFNMTAAFELVNFDGKTGELYCLYVEKFRGNFISLRKDVQDYMRSRFDLRVKFKPGVNGGDIFDLHTIASAENLPSDGIVVHTGNRQFFYKKNNTVDITRFLADRLEESHGIKVYRKDEMAPGLIYEFKTCVSNAAIEPLLDATGRMVPRPPLTKVLPNKLRNVLSAIKAPNLDDIKRIHAVEHPNQVCDVCASI